MNPDQSAFVEEINAGAPVPEVKPQDLRVALKFFADLRAQHVDDTSQDRGPSFFSSDLGRLCSPGANILAISMRSIVLERLLESERRNSNMQGMAREEAMVQAMATLPFTAAQLKDLDAVRKRVVDGT